MLPPTIAPGGMSINEIYDMFPIKGAPAPARALVRRTSSRCWPCTHSAHGRTLLLLDEISEGLAPVIVQS
jgi:branched-chain amino acid transport system ATP-binding protein